jgi:hypothetical protein
VTACGPSPLEPFPQSRGTQYSLVEQHLGEGCLTERPMTQAEFGAFCLCPGEAMSLFSKGAKDPGIQIGLGSALSVVVLVATVNFYRFFRYFPA